ncbi:putative lipid II flippase FtsW [Acidicapsa ligni]|uniref:putative lipid II flippase FtsW n=1 Tax=Acidicapsa ligni TaxID=542300 RepID=UPI0021DF71E1|nr:putative lipid II flippase FtsW [Acidicapsa ligni]
MAKRVGVDKWLFFTTLSLVVVGLAMVFSASAVMAQERFGSPYTFLGGQALWAFLGVIVLVVLMRIDYRRYNSKKFIYPAMGVTFVLLLAVFAVHGSHATHRWIRFGPFFTFQPSEIAKPMLALYLAWFLHSRLNAMRDWKHTLLPAAVPAFLFIGLIVKEPDLGTAIVLLGMTILVLVLAGMEWRYLIAIFAAVAPVLAALLIFVPWRLARMKVFLNPEADPKGAGFHINQSLIAVGTGGWTGRGYMEGVQKLFYLPEPHTDFIFANISEELGFIGAVLIVILFVVLGFRGLRTVFLLRDPFARLLAFGITITILIQAFFNMSVVVALLPTKGIPLPFISHGGTSLVIMLASIGILLNLTREID